MDVLKWLFDINNVLFMIGDYPMTAVELIGTAFGLWTVWYARQEKISSWPIGIVNVIFFFVLFYQVNLYSDMFLQVFFFFASLLGWYRWTHPKTIEETNKQAELKISFLDNKWRIALVGMSFVSIVFLGGFMEIIHEVFPVAFPEPAAFPYWDAVTTILSIVAVTLLAQKKLESWMLWITIDIIATVLYYFKDIHLVSVEYIIFGIISGTGLYSWMKEYNSYE